MSNKKWWIPDYESLRHRKDELKDTIEARMRQLKVRFCEHCTQVYEFTHQNGKIRITGKQRILEDFPSYGIIRKACIKCERKMSNENNDDNNDDSNAIYDDSSLYCLQEDY